MNEAHVRSLSMLSNFTFLIYFILLFAYSLHLCDSLIPSILLTMSSVLFIFKSFSPSVQLCNIFIFPFYSFSFGLSVSTFQLHLLIYDFLAFSFELLCLKRILLQFFEPMGNCFSKHFLAIWGDLLF